MILLLLALLPLDLAAVKQAPERGGLRLEAVLEGRRIGARLVNGGAAPLDVLVGYTCGGPEPFVAVIDGQERSFQTGLVVCTGNAMVIEHLGPGAARLVPSQTLILDGAAHAVSVRYRNPPASWANKLWHGELTTPPRRVPAAELEVELRAKSNQPGTVDLEMIHRWHGATRLRFFTGWAGVCASPADQLLLDERPRSFIETPCDGPAAPLTEAVAPGGSFVTRATLHLERGIHRLRTRYRVTPEQITQIGIKGNIGDFVGEAETPEINLQVR